MIDDPELERILKSLATKDDVARWALYVVVAVIFCGIAVAWSYLR